MTSAIDKVRAAISDVPQTAREISVIAKLSTQAVSGALNALLIRGEVAKHISGKGRITWVRLGSLAEDPNKYFNQYIRNRIEGEKNAGR